MKQPDQKQQRRYPILRDFLMTVGGELFLLEGFTAPGDLICRAIPTDDQAPTSKVLLIHPDRFFTAA